MPARPVIATVARPPPLWVITPVLNARATIRAHLASVDRCDYPDLTHILVDGGSRDGTRETITAHLHPRRHLINAPGQGIYQAMNTAAARAPADARLVFINADDQALPHWPIDELAALPPTCPAAFAHVLQHDRHSRAIRVYPCHLPRHFTAREFLHQPVHHQGYLPLAAFHAAHPYRPELGIHADYAQMAMALASGRCRLLRRPLVLFRTGGASDYFSERNWSSLRLVASALGLSWHRSLANNPTKTLRMLTKLAVGRIGFAGYRQLRARYGHHAR